MNKAISETFKISGNFNLWSNLDSNKVTTISRQEIILRERGEEWEWMEKQLAEWRSKSSSKAKRLAQNTKTVDRKISENKKEGMNWDWGVGGGEGFNHMSNSGLCSERRCSMKAQIISNKRI